MIGTVVVDEQRLAIDRITLGGGTILLHCSGWIDRSLTLGETQMVVFAADGTVVAAFPNGIGQIDGPKRKGRHHVSMELPMHFASVNGWNQ